MIYVRERNKCCAKNLIISKLGWNKVNTVFESAIPHHFIK